MFCGSVAATDPARRILAEGEAPGKRLNCETAEGRRLSQTAGVASVRPPPVVGLRDSWRAADGRRPARSARRCAERRLAHSGAGTPRGDVGHLSALLQRRPAAPPRRIPRHLARPPIWRTRPRSRAPGGWLPAADRSKSPWRFRRVGGWRRCERSAWGRWPRRAWTSPNGSSRLREPAAGTSTGTG